MKAFLFSLLIFVSSCHAGTAQRQICSLPTCIATFSYYMEDDFLYKDAVIEGMHFWEELAGCRLFTRGNIDNHAVLIGMDPEKSATEPNWLAYVGPWHRATRWLGDKGIARRTIMMYTRYTYYGRYLHVITIHELGHVLGLDHTKNTVMNPTLWPEYPILITKSQVAKVQKYCTTN